jgi:hypothetical protein
MKPPGTNAGSGSISRVAQRFADRRPKIPLLRFSDDSNVQDSNRECIRLKTAVTQTKERMRTTSNREKEAPFFGPSRGGSFLSDPPAFRPRLYGREPEAKVRSHPSPTHQNPNRECIRLETAVTQTKQRIRITSNREKRSAFFDVEIESRPQGLDRVEAMATPTATAGEKSKSAPPKSVAIKTEADRLFCWSYEKF